MTVVLRRVNRVLLGLAGLLLVLGGGAVLAAGLDLSVPSWWPWSGPSDVLLSAADRQRWRDESWWWPVVIAGLGLVVLLALWWLLVQFRRARLREVLVDTGDGEEAILRGRSLEAVLEADAAAQEGVSKARVHLTGRRATPGPASRSSWSRTPPRETPSTPSAPRPSRTPVRPRGSPHCPRRPVCGP